MNNKKLCILISIMVLGITNISYAEEIQSIENSTNTTISQEDENIKANKATYEKAVLAMENKDYQSAIVYLTVYINAKPKKYEAYKLRGDCFYALRQYSLAEKDYQTAINLKTADDKLMTGTKYVSAVILGADKNEQLQNPELGNLYGRLMYAQKALGNNEYQTAYANAVKYNSHIYLPQPKKEDISKINFPQKYGKVVNPTGADEYIYGAIEDIEEEKYNDAIFKSQYLISNYPKYFLGYYLNGVALSGLEKGDEALIAFNKALEKNPYDFESMASLGDIYFDKAQITFSQDDARKSIEYFKKALEYNKNCYLYHFYIGMNELQLGNTDTAISEFNKAIKIKPNDYNSLYYKLIAQYINKDYTSVLNGATKLLYKRVSNYNSVLYLRALAYFESKDYEKASMDLDTILGNMDDIYNADIKVLSQKERTLENYVYYLRAKISLVQGNGAKSDLEKAYQNPIIAMLDKVQKAIKPYEESLNGENLSLEDYEKYSAFYETRLPKLLQSGAVVTENDIDNQYDYIRTTFGDMGLSFEYTNPDYKLSTIKDYPYKKYYSKLSSQDLEQIKTSEEAKNDVENTKNVLPKLRMSSESVQPYIEPGEGSLAKEFAASEKKETKEKGVISLQESTPQEEMLVSPSETSLAQILATNSFGILGPVIPEELKETDAKTSISVPESARQEVLNPVITDEKSASNASSGEPFIYTNKPSSINKENAQNVKKIVEDEKKLDESSAVADGIKITAEEIKESREISIKYKNPEDVTETVEQEVKKVIKVQPEPENIIEKHAVINTDEIDITNKIEPVINPEDEVIILDKTLKPLYSQEDKLATEALTNNNFNKKNDFMRLSSDIEKFNDTSVQKALVDVSQTQTQEPSNISIKLEEPSVTIPETEVLNNEKIVEVPIVNVPEITDIPPAETKNVEKNENIAAINDVSEISLRPKTEETPVENKEIINDTLSDATPQSVEIEKERLEIAKIKAAEEAKARKAEIKVQKEKIKELAKTEKQKAKLDAIIQKEQLKAEKVKAKELAKELKTQEKETKKLQKAQINSEKLKEKELKQAEKAKAKAEMQAQKEQKTIDKAHQKEQLKIQKAQETAEKAVRDSKKSLEEETSTDLKFPKIFQKSDKTIEPQEVKKTVIKKLEQ